MIVPIPRPTQSKATGVFRHRLGFFGRLILQAEYEYFMVRYPHESKTKENRHTCWQDATVADLTKFDNPTFIKHII